MDVESRRSRRALAAALAQREPSKNMQKEKQNDNFSLQRGYGSVRVRSYEGKLTPFPE